MLAGLDREFPEAVEPNRRRHFFCRLETRARVEPCVHPNHKVMNQNSLMGWIFRGGEEECKGHTSGWQS
jgi:hypothetical protein